MRTRICLALMAMLMCGAIGASAGAAGQTAHVLAMTAYDLNGRMIEVPRAMGGDPSVWVLGFDRAQQPQIDRIFALLATLRKGHPALDVWEVPVIEDPGAVVRFFIDNGMKSGIQGDARRAKVVTLYVASRAEWLRSAGITTTAEAVVVRVSADGQVVRMAKQSEIKDAATMEMFLVAPAP